MKKIANREYVKEMLYENLSTPVYCHVEHTWWNNSYAIFRDDNGHIIVSGKELKGYLGDIIYPQYNGWRFATGDYQLKSDRHGVICKWKEVKIK